MNRNNRGLSPVVRSPVVRSPVVREEIPGLGLPGYTEIGLKPVIAGIEKYKLAHELLSFDSSCPRSKSGYSLFASDTALELGKYIDGVGKRMAHGRAGMQTAIFLHAFLLQYRQSGAVLPRVHSKVVARNPDIQVVERDMIWALKLLLPSIASREALIKRLGEADAARLAAWGDEAYLPASYATEVCFDTECYQRYLKFRRQSDSPPEPPIATHEEIVAWLRDGRIRTPQPNGEALCNYCLIDRRDGSWSIYGWNDGDGQDRYPPSEIIRYYDEAMAYEFLLNAALQAVV